MKATLKKKGCLTQYQKGVPNKVAGTFTFIEVLGYHAT